MEKYNYMEVIMSEIEVKNLTKQYKLKENKEGFIGTLMGFLKPKYYYKTAVNSINFKIESGECVGYIGENGAGKSTTIKMLSGILHPTSGEITVNGLVPYKNRIKNNKKIGTVFGQRSQLWWDLPVIESFKVNKKIYEIPDEVYEKNMQKYRDILNFDEILNIPVRNLSLGQRMKCEIALAFLHDPKVVYLDEPTIGLDVLVKDEIRKFIKYLNRENKTTIMLTTHDLNDIQEVCDRIIVLDKGEILYDGSLEQFMDEYGKERIITFTLQSIDEEVEKKLQKRKEISEVEVKENILKIHFLKNEATANDMIKVVSKYSEIIDLEITEPDLEVIVKKIYRKGK